MDKPETVAIIGGGISGLSVAFELLRREVKGETITVFEKSPSFGGNADTAEVELGHDFRDNTPFTRFADLGVNDINLNSYPRTRTAMEQIGYIPAERPKEPVEYKHLRFLEDTVCLFTPDSEEIWTKDGFLMGEDQNGAPGVVDTRFSLNHPKHDALRHAEERFMDLAAKDFDKEKQGASYWNDTVDEYVAKFLELHEDAKEDVTPELLDRLVRLFLKPRIGAMYFADEVAGPGGMPMRGVMSYYRLQEGFGAGDDKPIADRRYFRYGSQHWINALKDHLADAGVQFRTEFEAHVMDDGAGGVRVFRKGNPDEYADFQKVVMAAHADHQLESLTQAEGSLLSDEVAKALAKIEYSDSVSIAHTYAGVLPANVDSWRTYNVMIREDRERTPYQMTYVQNRHRNDRMSDNYPDEEDRKFNEYGLPVYFVSLNPEVDIDDKYILDVTEASQTERMNAQPGYPPPLLQGVFADGKARAYFRHTIITKDLLGIQDELPKYQGMAEGRVYFAGCWAIGAGLHEECFMQSEAVVDKILEPQAS